MKHLIKLDGKNNAAVKDYGKKAYWLNELKAKDFLIPDSYAMTAVNYSFVNDEYFDEVAEEVISVFDVKVKTIAVRSSSFREDSQNESCAGIYETELNVKKEKSEIVLAVKKVLQSAQSSDERIGVLFQPMIDAEIAGVMFTSNPGNNSKRQMVVNYTFGLGDKLVSGKTSGTEVVVNKDEVEKIENDWLKKLCRFGVSAENRFFPCDVEWCVEKGTGKIFLLQMRPMTSACLKEKDFVIDVTKKNLENKNWLSNLGKVKMRLEAECKNLLISPAYIVHCNSFTKYDFSSIDKINGRRSKYCRGFNVVVISPKLVDKKIIRSFVGDKSNISNCLTCNRYGVRAEPDFYTLSETVKNFYERLKNEYMSFTMIIQEIFDPEYTGIIRKSGDNYYIELAKGHFVAKGIVPMSTFVLDKDFNLVTKRLCHQEKYFGLLEGHTLEFIYGKEVDIEERELKKIAHVFSSYLDEKNACVEFGILQEADDYLPYLIDYTDDAAGDVITPEQVNSGVISNGYGKGKVVRLSSEGLKTSLNSHFFDQQNAEKKSDSEKYIYLCDLPDISFKDKLTENCAGFLFKDAAALCHLAVLLREKGIPAVTGVDEIMIEEGSVYEINTEVKGTWEEKVRRI